MRTTVYIFLALLAGTVFSAPKTIDSTALLLAREINVLRQLKVEKLQQLEERETVRWNNPESGNYGTVTPTRDGYSSAGRYCREYQQTIVVNGRNQTGYGQACQSPDGSWEIVS